jgi:hypothetical protein
VTVGIEPTTVVLTAPCSASELHHNKWFSERDSNPRHAACKTAVLAAELPENGDPTGNRTPDFAWTVRCSYHYSIGPKKFGRDYQQ